MNFEKVEVKYIEDICSQTLRCKFLLEDFYHKKYDMALCAGFLGMKQDPKTYQMSFCIGWYIEENDQKKIMSKNREYAIRRINHE